MRSNATWSGMIDLELRLRVYCTPCDRVVDIDMTKFPPDGNAIGVRFRCEKCGRIGQNSVTPIAAESCKP